MRQITACLAATALALGASVAAAPAYAADDIGSNPITELFDSIGLGSKEKPEIEYRDRAPLVPPSNVSALPAPVAKNSSETGGDWPRDPDVQRRAEAKARGDVLPTETYEYRMDKNSRLSPTELQRRRVAGASAVTEPGSGTRLDNQNDRLSPDALRSQRIHKGAVDGGLVNGQRSKLSDPPAGYLAGTGVTAEVKEEKPWYGKLLGGN